MFISPAGIRDAARWRHHPATICGAVTWLISQVTRRRQIPAPVWPCNWTECPPQTDRGVASRRQGDRTLVRRRLFRKKTTVKIQTFMHRRRSQTCRATASSSGAVRVRRLAQGHLDTRRSQGLNHQPPEPHAAIKHTDFVQRQPTVMASSPA